MSCGFDGTHLLAFFVGGALALLTAALVQQHVAQRLRKRNAVHHCKTEGSAGNAPAGGADAAKDIEKGVSNTAGSAALSHDVDHLCDKIRLLLEAEAQKGVTMKELETRLDGLLKFSADATQLEATTVSTLRESAAPASSEGGVLPFATAVQATDPEHGRPKVSSKASADTRTPSSSNRSGSTDREAEELPGTVVPPDKPGKEPLPPPLPPANLEPVRDEASGPPKLLGPTDRQCAIADPPEKCLAFVDEDESQRNSVATLQRILSKRDVQTTELHRQLRDTRQQLWQQTAEARAATARLNACLGDASRAPHEQAEAITRLQSQVKELSGKLADARHQEQQWACIAKRQRAYLQQSERLSQEGMQILRRHPAGEVFLAPPPVFLDDEDIRDEPVWDVGTGRTSSGGDAHCNPYVIDSWPFEPNVLAARASVQPNLNQWDEGDEDYDDVDEDLDEDDPQWQWDERMAPDEETSSLEPEHAMKAPVGRGATLPPLTVPVGGASARSL